MTRVSSLAASNSMMQQIMQTQQRMFGLDVQVSSGKTAQAYTGIAGQSEYMINMENLRSSIETFRRNNKNERVRQDASMTALEGIKKSMQRFRKALVNFGSGGMDDEVKVKRMQNQAFQSLKEMEAFLNTKADGRYLFSGSRVRTEPIRLGLTTLADFQDKYNGASVKYAETRAQHISDVHVREDDGGRPHYLQFRPANGDPPRSSVTLPDAAMAAQFTEGSVIHITKASDPANNGSWKIVEIDGARLVLETEAFQDSAGDMTAQVKFDDRTDGAVTAVGGFDFVQDPGTGDTARSTIQALTPGALSRLKPGQTFTVENAADPNNDGTYTVHSVNGDTVTIESKLMRFSGVNAATPGYEFAATLAAGDTIALADGGPGRDDTITLGAGGAFIDAAGNALRPGSELVLTGDALTRARFRVTSVSADRRTIGVQALDGGDAGLTTQTFGDAVGHANTVVRITRSSGEISTNRYYKGDEISRTHRIDELRSYENDLTAIHPGIEKALRAMSIIAQGKFETEGGLDNNQERARAARYLIESALDLPIEIVNEPYGREEAGNINGMLEDVGYNQVLLNNMENAHRRLSTAFANRTGDIENAEKTETITALLNEQRVLQASMQSFARLQQLSLSNFL